MSNWKGNELREILSARVRRNKGREEAWVLVNQLWTDSLWTKQTTRDMQN